MRTKLIIIAITLITIIVSCAKVETKNEINVAISPDFYPFSYTVADSLAGLEIELLKLLEKRMKTTINLHKFYHHNMIGSFNASDLDMAIGGITINDSRI